MPEFERRTRMRYVNLYPVKSTIVPSENNAYPASSVVNQIPARPDMVREQSLHARTDTMLLTGCQPVSDFRFDLSPVEIRFPPARGF